MDEMMMPPKISIPFDIPCYMFGADASLRPASFMDIAQQLAVLGSQQFGMSDSDLRKYNYVWIIVRMRIRFEHIPHRQERVIEQTWHRGLERSKFIRDYRLVYEDGTIAVNSTSSWIIMDLGERSIVRGDRLGNLIPVGPQCDEAAIEESAPKLVWPSGLGKTFACTHRARPSDLDYNGHVNNARYLSWVFDYLPEETSGGTPFDISINFNHEVPAGSSVDLYYGRESDKVWYMEGQTGDVQNFICRVEFA